MDDYKTLLDWFINDFIELPFTFMRWLFTPFVELLENALVDLGLTDLSFVNSILDMLPQDFALIDYLSVSAIIVIIAWKIIDLFVL